MSRDKINLFKSVTGNSFEKEKTKVPDGLWPIDKLWVN